MNDGFARSHSLRNIFYCKYLLYCCSKRCCYQCVWNTPVTFRQCGADLRFFFEGLHLWRYRYLRRGVWHKITTVMTRDPIHMMLSHQCPAHIVKSRYSEVTNLFTIVREGQVPLYRNNPSDCFTIAGFDFDCTSQQLILLNYCQWKIAVWLN